MADKKYAQDNDKEQNINTKNWQDSNKMDNKSTNNDDSSDNDYSENIPKLTKEEQAEQDKKRNSPEFEQELQNILPKEQIVQAKKDPETLDALIKEHENNMESVDSDQTNATGLPDKLKQGMENLSGLDLSAVKVHYNSSKPAEVGALAYTQGMDIHVAPGQEKHVPHELAHVVQQMQGRVKPTTSVNGMPVNDNVSLEKEADAMGDKAAKLNNTNPEQELSTTNKGDGDSVQRLKWSEVYTGKKESIELSKSQMPDGVEAVTGEDATKDRNVWAGQSKKGRSGFLWHKEGTLEVRYDIKEMTQYKVIDPDAVFYTAVRTSAIDPIKEHGIDPNYGNVEQPDGPTHYNVRGFNYFGKDKKTPTLYGGYLDPEPWKIISFKLPVGTLIERDPEIPNGLRTEYHIQPGDISF